MTAIHEPRTFSFAEQMSRSAAHDGIRRLVDAHDLTYPITVTCCKGTSGPLVLYVDTVADRTAWLAVLDEPPVIAGRSVLVYELAPTGGALTEVTAELPFVDFPIDEPIPYVPVAMPTGDAANTAECARLRGAYDSPAVQRAIHESIHGPTPSEPVDLDDDAFTAEAIAHRHEPAHIVDVTTDASDLDAGRGGAGMVGLLPEDLPRDVALEFSHHRGLSDTHKVRIDTKGIVWLHCANGAWVKTGEVDLTDIRVAEIDAHCDVENFLKAQDANPQQASFAEALPRLQAQRDDETFAEITGAVTL